MREQPERTVVVVPAQVGIIVGPMNLAGSFKTYALYATLLNNVGQALGMLIGCTFKSKEVAMQVRHPTTTATLSSLSETRAPASATAGQAHS